MSDNSVMNFLVERLTAKGWLSISSLYFDNSHWIDIYNSRGYVAYSAAKHMFFEYNCIDSTGTANIENTYVALDRRSRGMQQVITAIGDFNLQRFDIAQYSHYQFYNDAQTKIPWPENLPTKAQLDALVKDETTGLYAGTSTVGYINDVEKSVIDMYSHTAGMQQDTNDWAYSGAIIDTWKRFYNNQEKFKAMIKDQFGVTDAI